MRTPRFWQTQNLTSTALLPASLLYRIGAWADRAFTTPKRADVPVISIGNVTAGGAGKTPTTLALIPILRALGHTPHILTRGYGGTHLTAHRVTAADGWKQVGDEALLLAAAAPTWVGRDRHASAIAATQAGATILLCDDALQHYALHKDISILVIDGPYGIGNGAVLPAGPLREPLEAALKRCNAAILIGADIHQLAPRIALPTFTASIQPRAPIASLKTQKWLSFAGIGRPEKFFDSLRALGANLVETRSFADHHAYSEADISALATRAAKQGAQIITTEKDWVKLSATQQATITAFPIALTFTNNTGLERFLQEALGSKQPS